MHKKSRGKVFLVFIAVIVIGFLLFSAPNIFFSITEFNGGFKGVNLLITALFQFLSVLLLIYLALNWLKKDFSYIGLTVKNWKKDVLLGGFSGISWAALQFSLIIPHTGGEERADIQAMQTMMDGTLMSMLSYIALGVIGGGITEEIFNRGFFINVLRDLFSNKRIGLYIAAIASVVFFAIGHLPGNKIEWMDILIPTLIYTALFITTKRLTASMVAHGIYNLLAILLVYYLYYNN